MMQFMPATALEMGLTDRADARSSIHAGARYMRQLYDRFVRELQPGEMTHPYMLALAAYNSGPTRVSRLGRIPRIKETEEYVYSIVSLWTQWHTRGE